MAAISRQRLIDELNLLGLCHDDTVMMHSSLSSLGYVDGGAETVVDAILDTLGPKGTLLVPAFHEGVWSDPANFTISDCCPCPQSLCPSKQPGFQGVIPEEIRQRPGALRSCHPTDSWVALGPKAEQLLSGHRDAPTPCGPGNPFEQLLALDGWILTLGVGVNTVTLWHYYEEILRVPYLGYYWPDKRHLNHCVTGLRIQYDYPGIMQDVCIAAGILKTGPVGKSSSGLMRARQFKEFMATIMADDPYCFVLRPASRHCGDLALDALQKAAAMLRAWADGPKEPPRSFGYPLQSPRAAKPGDIIRQDCPAFAGFGDAEGESVALCRANGRSPEYFQLGGKFDQHGPTTCGHCSWHLKFRPES